MNPYRVDYLVDLAYGVMVFVSIVLIVYVATNVGVAFGLGVLVSYIIHVAWKMARFDPEWMTEKVAENVEESLSNDIEGIIDQLEEVNKRVDKRPRADEIETKSSTTVGAPEQPPGETDNG